MILNIGSLMFNMNLNNGGTPSWGTDMGQEEGYKFTLDNIENLITSLTYMCVDDMENIGCEFGKGGSRTDDYRIVLASLYKKVYVNDEILPEAEFLLVMAKQINNPSGFHIGRKTLKYSPNMTYRNVKINEKCFELIRKKFSLNDNSAWFISEINTKNQDEIHLKVYVADKEKTLYFENTYDRKDYVKKIMQNEEYDLEKLLTLENKQFAFESIKILKKYMNDEVLNILTTKELSNKNTKHLYAILTEENSQYDPRRYYQEIVDIFGKKYKLSNDWYLKNDDNSGWDNRNSYIDFIKKVINGEFGKPCRVNNGCNKIYYGAPGTGKSYKIDQDLKDVSDECKFRITFHPEYTYNDFIGQLLPMVKTSGENKDEITYSFKKGPFTLALEKAYKSPSENVYLIIEEMSRGNCAAIFGDIFQLLDRIKEGENKNWSRYFVNNDIIAKDIKYISDGKIKIPSNLYILGTVNTSDQNVFVMDTAFKRRFEWEYISTKPVLETKPYLNNVELSFYNGNENKNVNWIDLYGILNKFISSSDKLGLGEDKQIGQFFIEFNGKNDKEKIKNKLLHYLWFDIQQATYKTEVKLFDDSISSFSDLYDKYESNEKIFSDHFFECIEAWNKNSL